MPPLNLTGDFGGGSMFLIVGILSALWERQSSGKGQVVDAAMIDGSSMLMAMMWGMRARRPVVRRARRQHARQRRARTTTPTSAPTAATSSVGVDRAAVLRRAAQGARPRRRGSARPERRQPVARAARPRSPRSFAVEPTATTGPRCSPAATPARRRCCRSPRCETEPHITERDTFYLDGDVPAADARAAVLPQRAVRPRRRPGEPGADTEAVLRDWVIESFEKERIVEIKDAVAVVTGGASGLGLATTKRLLDRGASVVVHRPQG